MLPKFVPLHKKVHLPVADKDVKVYAYTLGEERNLMIYKEGGTKEELENCIFELLESKCPDIKIDSITMFDLIIIFLASVDISKGLKTEVNYKCLIKNEEGRECGGIMNVVVDLGKYDVNGTIESSKLIKINKDVSIDVSYPTIGDLKNIKKYVNDKDYILRLYSKCIKTIYTNDEVYNEFSDDEIFNWICSLPSSVLPEFESFISSIPSISVEYEAECPRCHHIHKYKFNNIIDFFI